MGLTKSLRRPPTARFTASAFDGEVEAVGLVFDCLEGAEGESARVGLRLPVRRAASSLLDGEQSFAGEVGRAVERVA